MIPISRRVAVIAIAILGSSLAFAAASKNVPRIGQVWFSTPSTAGPYDVAFREGLRGLGYVDGDNIAIVARYANGDDAQASAALEELIALPVDILMVSPRVVHAAKQKTATIPIVCPDMGNPLRDGLVTNLARPGSNLTGGYALDTETNAKRLELAKELVPGVKRVGVMFDAADVSLVANAKALRTLGDGIGVNIRELGVRNWSDIQGVLAMIERNKLQALIIFDNPLTEWHLEAIMKVVAHRLPVVSEGRDWARAGALLTYGTDYHDMWRYGAVFVDRILKGAKPGDIPIEHPTKFQLLVNMKTAKALRIAVPESILLRADEFIR